MKRIFNWFSKILRSDFWILKDYRQSQKQIFEQWKIFSTLTDEQIKNKSINFQNKLKNASDKLISQELVTAYALIAEVIFRVHKIRLHPVQILGAIALHYGNVSEMKTGEGKTLTALLPAYLKALSGFPVYIVTVNEYLVTRDTKANAPIFQRLNLELGAVISTMSRLDKIENYKKNVIYITNSEIGFDYLRDNMIGIGQPKIQGKLSYVIIDEADSILIDEARVPLIISGKSVDRQEMYQKVDKFISSLKPTDYRIALEFKNVYLTKSGYKKANVFFNLSNLQSVENAELFHFAQNGLYAHYILHKNVDYLIRDKKVMLIDHFTGRILGDRMLSNGLHQALEAKEQVSIQPETSILATITYQNFFRLFDKIAGMTGTAIDVEEDFIKTYNMDVLQIPTNQPLIRQDQNDFFFTTKKAKYLALAHEIEQLYFRGQPVLVGSNSVQTSEEISQLLKFMKVPHSVLSAKHHSFEAKIIAQAGWSKSVTIATNIAGRGTDIILDETAKSLGGLVVLGAEKNESSRIDWQLRGRSGRQGEPGRSQFYVSLDDELFSRFGTSKLKNRFGAIKTKGFSSRLLSGFFRRAQAKLTNASFDQRKSLLDFDNIVSQQRILVYARRDFLLQTTNPHLYLQHFFARFIFLMTKTKFIHQLDLSKAQMEKWINELKTQKIISDSCVLPSKLSTWSEHDAHSWIANSINFFWTSLFKSTDKKQLLYVARSIILKQLDNFWTDHLNELSRIKASSYLQSYAQKQPLEKFIEEAEKLFSQFQDQVILKAAAELLAGCEKYYQELVAKNFLKPFEPTNFFMQAQ